MSGMEPLPDVSYDAVIIVPGIMGSKLCDAQTGETLWGFSQFEKYSKFWLTDTAFKRLVPTADEIAGKATRVKPCGILRLVPAAAPILQGIEPYDALVKRATAAVADPKALLEFAYDWRLSVEHNARLLAKAAYDHLKAWREHPASKRAPDGHKPRLVIVAHSMGGLVARSLSLVEGKDGVPEITPEIRATVTLGTPFAGAVKAAVLLETGKGTPIPLAHQGRMRKLAATLPGVYDLLPMYRCVEDGDQLRRYTIQDAKNVGGSDELADAAIQFNARLKDVELPGHHALVGTTQPTLQGLHLSNGEFTPLLDAFAWGPDGPLLDPLGKFRREVAYGDGTVAQDSAEMNLDKPSTLPQQHGALARSVESINYAIDVVRRQLFGPRQGEGDLGIVVPDVVEPLQPWEIEITGAGADVAVRVVDVESNTETAPPKLAIHSAGVKATVEVDDAGLYRVEVDGGGLSPVSQVVIAQG